MNCKPGDLAIIVGSHQGKLDGRIVQVHRLGIPGEALPSDIRPATDAPVWLVESNRPLYPEWETDGWGFIYDRLLRPIRSESEPESIQEDRECPTTA